MEPVDPVYGAVRYLLDRVQTDPDLRYLLLGSEAFARLCQAEAHATGRPLGEVRSARERDAQPAHRRREPDVLALKRRVEQLEDELARVRP